MTEINKQIGKALDVILKFQFLNINGNPVDNEHEYNAKLNELVKFMS